MHKNYVLTHATLHLKSIVCSILWFIIKNRHLTTPRVYYLRTSIWRPPLLSGHKADPRRWPLNRGSTVFPWYGYSMEIVWILWWCNCKFHSMNFTFFHQWMPPSGVQFLLLESISHLQMSKFYLLVCTGNFAYFFHDKYSCSKASILALVYMSWGKLAIWKYKCCSCVWLNKEHLVESNLSTCMRLVSDLQNKSCEAQ
jgi:hypothetical protein